MFQGDPAIPLGLFSAGAEVQLPLLGGQVCPGAQAEAPSRLSAQLYCTNIPAALIALALRSAVWRGREGGVHWLWSLLNYLSYALMWVTIKLGTSSF